MTIINKVIHVQVIYVYVLVVYLVRDRLAIPNVNKKMKSFKGQASWAKMTSTGGKLVVLVCHPTKKVNKSQ
jgi:hypothetical protein